MPGRASAFICLIPLASFLAPAGRAAEEAPAQPRFQSRIDLITIDVAALDGRGRPVEDLRARDFTVTVDGRARDVVSAELVRVDRNEVPAPASASTAALISTNDGAALGRRVAIAVDQMLVAPGSITPLLRTAARFVDGLAPGDYAAFLTLPEPGPRVDFTTDKARVREALHGVVGQAQKITAGAFSISLSESLAIQEKERVFISALGDTEAMWRTLGPMARRVLERGCQGLPLEELLRPENVETLRQCVNAMVAEASLNVQEARTDATLSLRRLESLIAGLAPIDGPKSLVLISAGLLVEDLSRLEELARLAAAARTSITVLAVEPQREREIRDLPNSQPTTTLQDRSLELQGLETIADRTGGFFVRALAGTGEGIFDRVATELSAWYVVAVERHPSDPDRQRVEVGVKRRGVRLRSNRIFASASATRPSRPQEELLREALSSPIAVAGIPLRVSTFARKDAASDGLRVHVAAHVGQPGEPAGEFLVGAVLLDDDGRTVASRAERRQLSPEGGRSPLHFDMAIAIDPGAYWLRLGAVDAAGRRGTVIRHVDLRGLAEDGLTIGDLIVGRVPAEGESLHPAVTPTAPGGRLAAQLEIYLQGDEAPDLSVTLEVAEGDASPALATARLNLGPGARSSWRVASGMIEASLLPGRYLARVLVTHGSSPLRVLARPFEIVRSEGTVTRLARARAVAIPDVFRRRTAAYVSAVVGSLSNIVAREDFALEDPRRGVVSDVLLVRYPGSDRDLLFFRDALSVNGVDLPGRQQRLTDLFLEPVTDIRDRVRDIAAAAEAHVPPVLNPIFVVAFLQPDFQPRFALTVSDAGDEWPREVKAVTFVETARPTLLRAGPFGTLDVPSRGTAWVEEATGRILQTELELGSGRAATRIVTRFALDERLQIMVPAEVRTRNPDGAATYRDFRRFDVRTDSTLKKDP
jgi:VWFA-related protein